MIPSMLHTAKTRAASSFAARRAMASLSVQQQQATNSFENRHHQWSGTLSYAQAESDFTVSSNDYQHQHTAAPEQQQPTEWWSHTLSFAAPESDFTASDQFVSSNVKDASANAWSGSLSFAAPESDFVSAPMTALGMIHVGEVLPGTAAEEHDKSPTFSISADVDFLDAPETALGMVHAREFEAQQDYKNEDSVMLDLSNPMVTAPETATGSISILELLDDDLKSQLQHYVQAKEALPTTVEKAMQDERPIVITKAQAPFEVYDVNAAWEGLCGYSREEAQHCSVGDLLQGPATDEALAMDMIRALKMRGFAEGTLTNYKKDGTEFTNTLQLGKVVHADEDEEVYFVGILHDATTKRAASSMM